MVYVTNDQDGLFVGIEFNRDLLALTSTEYPGQKSEFTLGLRIDEDADGPWNGGPIGEDGPSVQRFIQSGLRVTRFFDSFFTTQVFPPQGQRDDFFGGTVDGVVVAKEDPATNTSVVEFVHPLTVATSMTWRSRRAR